MDWDKWYKEGEDNCGIEKGDRVKVIGRAIDNKLGWRGIWQPGKELSIGNILSVKNIRDKNNGIELNNWLFYPFFVLELVEKAEAKSDLPSDILNLIDQEDFGCAKEPVKKLVAKILKIKSSQG